MKNYLLFFLLYTTSSFAQVLEKICEKYKEDKKVTILSYDITELGVQYQLNLLCQDKPRVIFEKYDFSIIADEIKPVKLEKPHITWFSDLNTLKITTQDQSLGKNLTSYVRFLYQEVETEKCDGCSSAKIQEGHKIKEVWYDKNGNEIPKPEKVNLGKKIYAVKDHYPVIFHLFAFGETISSVDEIDIMKSLIDFDEDLIEKLEEVYPKNSFINDKFSLSFNMNLLYSQKIVLSNEIASTYNFYRAQDIDCNDFFKELSK